MIELETDQNGTFGGATFTIKLSGTPLDLTDSAITAVFKEKYCSTTNSLELSEGDGITTTEPLSGMFQLDERVITLDPATYVFNVKVVLSDSKILYPVKGTLKVNQTIG